MACGAIKNMTVYYYKCSSPNVSLVEFGHFNGPSKTVGQELHEGKCVKNAEQVGDKKITLLCMWDGNIKTTGGCQCRDGYEKMDMEINAQVWITLYNIILYSLTCKHGIVFQSFFISNNFAQVIDSMLS